MQGGPLDAAKDEGTTLNLGVIGSSKKENERRVPLHPDHLSRLREGFFFAEPTTFDEPMIKVGSLDYYAVDHTPSYLWESASRSVSAALVVHIPSLLSGRDGWLANETIRRAVAIDRGTILHPSILSFQGRAAQYPHPPLPAKPN